jgi:hypothetical protein
LEFLMQFSLRRLLGFVTLGCVSIGVSMAFGVDASHPLNAFVDFLPAVARIGSAMLLFLAGYAALDPWLGFPSSLEKKWPRRTGESVRTGPVVLGLTILASVIVGLPGVLMMLLTVEDNWSMDAGSTSTVEWIAGTPLVVWGSASIVLVGASAVGLFMLFCGTLLGRGFGRIFCLCVAAMAGCMLAIPTYWLADKVADGAGPLGTRSTYTLMKIIGNATTGTTGIVLLVVGWIVGRRYLREVIGLGRTARRWAARCFLAGGLVGCALAAILDILWLHFPQRLVGVLIGGMFGAFGVAILGALFGARREVLPEQATAQS